MEIPYKIFPDGSMRVGNRVFGPPADSNKPMEHGDGSGGGGGGAGQSKKRTRRDGKNVSEPTGERISVGTFIPRIPSILSNSRGSLAEIAKREQAAMSLVWKNGNGPARLELVPFQSSGGGGGKKKKPDGKKNKKGKKKQETGEPGDNGGKARGGKAKPAKFKL